MIKLKKYIYEIMLLLTAAFWGLTFPAGKYIGYDFDSVSYLAIRLTIAAIILLFIFRKDVRNISSKMAIKAFLIGSLLAIHSFIQLEGLRYTSSGNSAFITSVNVVFVPLFAFLFFRKKPQRGFASGIIVIIAGFLLISGIVLLKPLSFNLTELNYGDFLTLIVAVLTALYFVLLETVTDSNNEAAVNVVHMAGAAVTMWIFWLFYPEKTMNFVHIDTLMWILYCAVFGSAAAFYLLIKAQAKLSASKVAVICSLESVFALLFAAFIPGKNGLVEPITLTSALGGILILSGVIKISVKK